MPQSAFSPSSDDLEFPDLGSRPKHRYFRQHPLVERTRQAVPFDNVVISGLDLADFDYSTFRSVDSDLPPSFVYTYYEEELFREDPLMKTPPADNVLIEQQVYKRQPPSERLAYVLTSHNIRNRTYFLLRRNEHVYGAVGFTRQAPFTTEEVSYLKMISQPLHNAFTKPVMDRFAAENLKVTPAELICLKLASRGMTTEEISSATGYQKNTINTYFQLAARKLDAANRSQAIAEALRRGLIQ